MFYVRRNDAITVLPLYERTLAQLRAQGVTTVGQMFDDPHGIKDAKRWNNRLILGDSGYVLADWGVELPARSGTLYWSLNEQNELTIYGSGLMRDFTDTRRPPWDCFRGEITAVSIEENVENVGARAFENCPRLRRVILGEAVGRIGARAFADCPELRTVETPRTPANWREQPLDSGAENRLWLGNHAFAGTPWQAERWSGLYIREGILMEYQGNETTLSIPEGVEEIAPMVFEYTPLRAVKLPRSLKRIGRCAFQGTHLETLTLPGKLETVDAWAFRDVKELKQVMLLRSGTDIPPNAFSGTPVEAFSRRGFDRWPSIYRLNALEEPEMGPFRALELSVNQNRPFGTRAVNTRRELLRLLEEGGMILRLRRNTITGQARSLSAFYRNGFYPVVELIMEPRRDSSGTIRVHVSDFLVPDSGENAFSTIAGLRGRRGPGEYQWYCLNPIRCDTETIALDFLARWLSRNPEGSLPEEAK